MVTGAGAAAGQLIAVGRGSSFIWNGHSWRRVAVPGADDLASVSCSGSFCLAVGSSSAFAWNGRKWSTLPSTGIGNAAVWCTGRAACMDVGSGLASSWNGRQWTPVRLSKIERLSGVSCTRPGNCIAVGETNNVTLASDRLAERWNGSAWQVVAGPVMTVGTGGEGISCPSTRFCMALNAAASDPGAERWNGSRWVATNLPASSNGAGGLSCSSASNCVAVGGQVAWIWDGTSWRATNAGVSGQVVFLEDASCSSATMCMVTGYDESLSCDVNCTIKLLVEQWNGLTWSVSDNPVYSVGSDIAPASQISCPSSTVCMEVTTGSGVMSWDGQTWTQQAVSFPRFVQTDISCGGTSSCVVVGNYVGPQGRLTDAAQVWNGMSWRATHLASGGLLNAVSCSMPGRCVAVGTTAADLTMAQSWNGTAWKLLSTVDP